MNVLLKCKTFCKNYDFNGTNISVFRAISIVLSVFLDVILHVIPINIPFLSGVVGMVYRSALGRALDIIVKNLQSVDIKNSVQVVDLMLEDDSCESADGVADHREFCLDRQFILVCITSSYVLTAVFGPSALQCFHINIFYNDFP